MNLEILGFIILVTVINIILSLFKGSDNLKLNILSCGIAGFSGLRNFDMIKLKFLLYWNSIERGTDATGIFTPKTGIVKDNSKAEDFMTDNKFWSKIKLDNVLIGHVRAKTFGANTSKNAHPFEYDRIIGCHNGTLKFHQTLAKVYGLDINKYDVDSQILISAMNINFTDQQKYEDRFKVLEEYEGAAALLFYDKNEDMLYACHDKERPLYYGYINNTEMYISSIRDSLEAIECTNIKSFPINTVHQIKNGKILSTSEYTTYVSPIDYTIAKIANFNDFVYIEKKYDNKEIKYLSLPLNIKGIIPNVSKSYMFVGYWIRVDAYHVNPSNNYTKDNWYLVHSYESGSTSFAGKIIVKGDDGTDVKLIINDFDTTNFIPVKGQYIKLIADIVSTKNNKIIFAKKGDICKVIKHEYGSNEVEFESLITGKTIIVHNELVRNLSYVENTNHVNKLKEILLLNTPAKEAPTCDISENKIVEKVKEYIADKGIDDIPFVNDAVIIEDDIEEEAAYDMYVSLDDYFNLINYTRTVINEISELNDKSDFVEINKKLGEIEDKMIDSYQIASVELEK